MSCDNFWIICDSARRKESASTTVYDVVDFNRYYIQLRLYTRATPTDIFIRKVVNLKVGEVAKALVSNVELMEAFMRKLSSCTSLPSGFTLIRSDWYVMWICLFFSTHVFVLLNKKIRKDLKKSNFLGNWCLPQRSVSIQSKKIHHQVGNQTYVTRLAKIYKIGKSIAAFGVKKHDRFVNVHEIMDTPLMCTCKKKSVGTQFLSQIQNLKNFPCSLLVSWSIYWFGRSKSPKSIWG